MDLLRRNPPFSLALALLATLCLLLAAPCRGQEAGRELVVTGDIDLAPYVFLAPDGTPQGFEVDLIREIAARKGYILKFQLKPWYQALRDLRTKRADVLLGAVYASTFSGALDFSIPHDYGHYAIFAKSSFRFRNLGELAMYDTAMQRADPVYDVLLAPAGILGVKTWTETGGDAFRALGAGRCGYVAAPYAAGMEFIDKLKLDGVAAIGEPVAPCVRRFAIRKGSPGLLAALNEGIDAAKASGGVERLRAKWFKHERRSFDRKDAVRYGLYVFIPLLIVLDGLLIWSFLLKRQVRRKSGDLQESRSNYKALFDGVAEAILICDGKGRIVEFNASAAKALSQDGASLSGRLVQSIFGEAAASLLSGSAKGVECQISGPDGGEAHFELSSGESFIGRRRFVTVIARDIGARKLAERLKADVERMTRHDLKGPLNGIAGVPELIRLRGQLTEEQDELLKLIEDSAWSMLGMINLSQDMYKIETGAYELRPVALNLSPLLKQALIETRPIVEARKLAVDVSLDGRPWQEINPFRVSGEEVLCRRLLSNLLKNAMEASPEEAPVSVELLKGDAFNTLRIRNRGAVPREIRDKFFEKYSSSGKKGGTGLGTYNALLITRLHGGEIKMETSEQDGTTISVSLPAAKEL